MKLYSVELTKTICVIAENKDEAEKVALREVEEDDGDFDCYSAREIVTKEKIPSDWKKSCPYGAKKGEWITCEDLLK